MSRSNVKILTVVGARPQFVKAAMVSRAIAVHNQRGQGPRIAEEIVHTGQHYDPAMSQVFFDELDIPEPAVNLAIGSGSHAETTARMLEGIEREIAARRPDWVLLYGDTNSTLAGALAAAKLHVPVAHVEAGLLSFNRQMPEEINRVLTDHVSDLLFCPTKTAVENLAREGITRGVYQVGDVMYDAALVFGEIARQRSTILVQLGLKPKGYYLATVHRAENTDDRGRLLGILQGLSELARELPVVFPVHPRTRKCIRDQGLPAHGDSIRMIEPVSFLDMIRLEQEAKVILTDSGGVQKEAYFHGVPCVTLRDETEWVETVEAGWNHLTGVRPERIVRAARDGRSGMTIGQYGTGRTAASVLDLLREDTARAA
jgi:UDP-GlcNAc3NAcA epimerase